MFCALCGADNPKDGRFCSKCGSVLQGQRGMPPPGSGYEVATAPYTGPTETSGTAIGSLICGILFFIFPAAIVAIVLGHLSLSTIRRSGGRLTGGGMATAGLVLGYMGVAVIPVALIVAAIAIPNLLRARMAANEASAVGSLRAINTAAESYRVICECGYPETLENMGPPAGGQHKGLYAEDLIDESLAHGRKDGYVFSYVSESHAPSTVNDAYVAGADPDRPNTTGTRHFFTDQTGIIRFDSTRAATKYSRILR